MAGCFGNHWVDRQIERETLRYLESETCGEGCCKDECEEFERCEDACTYCEEIGCKERKVPPVSSNAR